MPRDRFVHRGNYDIPKINFPDMDDEAKISKLKNFLIKEIGEKNEAHEIFSLFSLPCFPVISFFLCTARRDDK